MTSDPLNALFTWIRGADDAGVVDPRQQLRVREDGVRGMFASADIDAGDLLAWLPYDRLLSSEGQTKSASYLSLIHI